MASGEKNLLITIYKDGRFRYSNDAKVMVMVPEMNEWEDTSWLYEVKFADGTAQAGVSYYAEYGYYAAASVLGGVISMAVFALMLIVNWRAWWDTSATSRRLKAAKPPRNRKEGAPAETFGHREKINPQ